MTAWAGLSIRKSRKRKGWADTPREGRKTGFSVSLPMRGVRKSTRSSRPRTLKEVLGCRGSREGTGKKPSPAPVSDFDGLDRFRQALEGHEESYTPDPGVCV